MRPHRSYAAARSHGWTIVLTVVAAIVAFVPVSGPIIAQPIAGPTPTFTVETFTGPNFVDLWWDPSDISGCENFLIWRKTPETAYALVGTPDCGAGFYTDSTVNTDTDYQYQLSVQNNAELPGTIYTAFKSATPGQIGGTLHRTVSLGGALTVVGISVAADGTLALNNATMTGGTINDWAGSPPEQGTVVVSGGTFDGTTFGLTGASSAIAGGTFTGAVVGTHADVQDATFDDSTLGFEGNAAVSLSGSTFVASLVSLGETVVADVGSNDFLSSTLSIRGNAGGDVYDNAFIDSSLRIWEHAAVVIASNTFSGTIPGTLAFIDVTTDAGVTINTNTLAAANDTGLRPAILVQPETTPTDPVSYAISDNILTGKQAGLGIQVLTECGEATPNVEITGNTVSRFARAIDLSNQVCPGGAVDTTISGNTLTGNGYAIYDDVHGAESAVAAHNNCIAGNATGGVYCSNVSNVLNATGNYWGHSSGPTHPANPNGLGDRIWCNEAASEIVFSPWLESHACSVCNLTVAAVETIQTVQVISNTMPLVAGKPTIVRIYPDVDAGFAAIDGTLTGTRDSADLGTLQARSPIAAGSILDWDAARMDAGASLIFDLPQDWLSGVVVLRAEITTDLDTVQHTDSDLPALLKATETAVITTTATFHERQPLKIVYIPASVDTLNGYHAITPKDVQTVHEAILARFPLGEVTYRILPDVDRYANLSYTLADGAYFDYLSGVVRRWELINNPDDVANYYITIYGTTATSFTGSFINHGDLLNGKGACGLRDEGADCVIGVGCLLGLRPLGLEANDVPAPFNYTFPYADGLTHEVGYDTINGTLQSPDLYDLMTIEAMAGTSNWISDFHYEKVYLNLAPAPAARAGITAVGDYLYVSGLVGPDDGRFFPVVQLEDSPQPDEVTPVDVSGAYCLQSRDALGHIIESTCFNVDLTDPSTGLEADWAAFTAVLTPDADIRQLQLRYNGAVVKQLVVPNTAPEVTLVSAGYDATYRTVQVAWTAPLADAPGLRYHVHYSADNGVTWMPIAIDLPPDSVHYFDDAFHWGVRAAQIPDGAQARLRLIATDGFHETTVTSGAFTVPDVGPWIEITAPANNAVVDTFPIVLEGYAYDVENGDRTAAMTWASDIDGPLGTGDAVSVAGLSRGSHTITLSADDGGGNVGTDTIHLTVDVPVVYTAWVYLPLALR